MIRVECYAAYRGEQEPRAIRIGTRRIGVAEILDRWLAPDHRYFKVKGDDDAVYVLRHDPTADEWELTVLDRTDRTAGPIVDSEI
jgi:hypothetical protein